jgi:hypothetical protein
MVLTHLNLFRPPFVLIMTTIPRFRMQIAPPTLGSDGPNVAAAPIESVLDLGLSASHVPGESAPENSGDDIPDLDRTETPSETPSETPATSKKKGSFNYDREKGGYAQEWASLDEFYTWRRQEEQAFSIELILSRTSRPTGNAPPLFTQKREYRCSREHTGGVTKYEKKHPDRTRKIDSKKTGCGCQIHIKIYPHTQIVLGRYIADHDHEVGSANIAYTRMSHAAREKINSMLEQKMEHKEIVCTVNDRSSYAQI